jgi:hypothetical protein
MSRASCCQNCTANGAKSSPGPVKILQCIQKQLSLLLPSNQPCSNSHALCVPYEFLPHHRCHCFTAIRRQRHTLLKHLRRNLPIHLQQNKATQIRVHRDRYVWTSTCVQYQIQISTTVVGILGGTQLLVVPLYSAFKMSRKGACVRDVLAPSPQLQQHT